MRKAGCIESVNALLDTDRVLTVRDFADACPGLSMPAVYSRIRSLETAGKIVPVGKGKYTPYKKPKYSVDITPEMKSLCKAMTEGCVGVNNCISRRGKNTLVEVSRSDLDFVYDYLKTRLGKVVLAKDAERFPGVLEGYIFVGILVSDSPLMAVDGVPVPSLEKTLADQLRGVSKDPDKSRSVLDEFRKAFDVYPVNINRLTRYAARRGVSEELSTCLEKLDKKRIEMFSNIQKYLISTSIEKAWVFGSFARGEETSDSDLDLIVRYDKDSKTSLIGTLRYKNDLENLIGREVDLVEEGFLKPFAIPSAEADKYLIYER